MTNRISMLHCRKFPYKIVHSDNDRELQTAFFAKNNHAYELNVLEDMSERLQKDDLFLDVGANIGNHTLYIAALGINVVAFEANPLVADMLNDSIKLNGFESRITLHRVGIGAIHSKAKLITGSLNNLGGWRLRLLMDDEVIDKDKDIVEVLPLDDINFKQRVKVIKIDVEHMEYDVLKGANQLIVRDKPLIYLECHNAEEMRPIISLLESYDYYYHSSFNHFTHFFIPRDSSSPTDRDILHRLQYQLFYLHYASCLDMRRVSNLLNSLDEKITKIQEQLKKCNE